jgi:hypothetical protein
MSYRTLLSITALCCLLCLCSGCAGLRRPNTALYSELKQAGALGPKNGKALVVVYGQYEPPGGPWPFQKTPRPLSPRLERRRSENMRQFVGPAPFLVLANDEPLGHVGQNFFVAYEAAPGQVQLATTLGSGDMRKDMGTAARKAGIFVNPTTFLGVAVGRKKVRATLNVQPSQTYYFKLAFGDIWSRDKMVQVSAQEAERDLATSHLADPLSHR